MTAVSTETSKKSQQPQHRRNAERRLGELQRDEGPDGLGHNYAQSDGHGKFEVSIQREQDHEYQRDR